MPVVSGSGVRVVSALQAWKIEPQAYACSDRCCQEEMQYPGDVPWWMNVRKMPILQG